MESERNDRDRAGRIPSSSIGSLLDVRICAVELFHFSHDPAIARFTPHVPATNPSQPPSVWAIDATHAPLYWFPRDCPRVTAWPRDGEEERGFREAFHTVGHRVHAIELRWLPALATTVLYRYRFDASSFRPWAEASGQWVSEVEVVPLEVERRAPRGRRHRTPGRPEPLAVA
jgi:hypothetical protein